MPLDEVEDAYPEIWHERQFGPYTGLRQAYEDGLRFEGVDIDDPLPVDLLTKIGKAAEEITVAAVDLPEQPPVDVEPWSPSDLSGLPDLEEKP